MGNMHRTQCLSVLHVPSGKFEITYLIESQMYELCVVNNNAKGKQQKLVENPPF